MKIRLNVIRLLAMSLLIGNLGSVNAQNPDNGRSDGEPSTGKWNLALMTLGGKQFWTDRLVVPGYRIQNNVVTDHCRLLNKNNVRLAWGTYQQCKNRFDQLCAEQKLTGPTGKVVIVLHGLSRTRASMKSLSKYIDENSDFTVLNVGYASTRASLIDHALALDEIISHLPDAEEINFVGHSMGGIVVRLYLGTLAKANGTRPVDPRFRRMVMLGPPNNGSGFAKFLQNNLLFKTVLGNSGQALSADWENTNAKLATPPFEFGIIAGGQKEGAWLNNGLLDGQDDFVVSVDETKLNGAIDFLVKPLIHSTMMNDNEVQQATLEFLKNGYFVSEQLRNPIVNDKQSVPPDGEER